MRRDALIAAIAAVLFSAAAMAQMGNGAGPMAGYGMGGGGYGADGAYGSCGDLALECLGLTSDQRNRIATIMDESATERLALMDRLHDLRSDAVRTGNPDYTAMARVREEMWTLARVHRDRVDAVLTPAQRDRLHSGWGGTGGGRGIGGGR